SRRGPGDDELATLNRRHHMPSESKRPNPGAPTPEQIWEAGARTLMEGWQQAQAFWTNAARSWGSAASRPEHVPVSGPANGAVVVWRELAEAASAVGQAWMRLPLALATGAQPGELQAAVTQLTEAQGRAYTLWAETLQRVSGDAAKPQGGRGSS